MWLLIDSHFLCYIKRKQNNLQSDEIWEMIIPLEGFFCHQRLMLFSIFISLCVSWIVRTAKSPKWQRPPHYTGNRYLYDSQLLMIWSNNSAYKLLHLKHEFCVVSLYIDNLTCSIYSFKLTPSFLKTWVKIATLLCSLYINKINT